MLRIAIILMVLISSAFAGNNPAKEISSGNWVCGPKLTEADLKNKVILFEYWGPR
jgi:hypothetical protein